MSYVSNQFLLADNSSLANFKNWAQAISTAFSSAGWTQTADTGQVNWSTIVSVPTSGNFVYEIWQPADALQTGGTKFFLKVKYGTSSNTGPRIQFQVSTSTDGAGNVNGFSTGNYEPTQNNTVNQGSVLTWSCYFCGDTNRFALALWTNLFNSNTCNFIIGIERTHNTDGTDSSDGVTMLGYAIETAASNNVFQQSIIFGVGAATQYSNSIAIQQSGNQAINQATNGTIPVCPFFPEYGKIGNPMTVLCMVGSSIVAGGCEFTTTLYGATRTYLAAVSGHNNPTNSQICMRFD